ncbi:MAG: hypothetical protein ALECFALPRED_001351 [Alectoria fallacina]|uniref:Uncharacterized protein n=1 Tax=Alectoria fallacina TaxID=1903189 RepID=A0A8H3EJS7_9LECA|nr:MAG: hypothetical protein ALECFALPRED_001351 [Alectoria fallacina]
MFEDHVHMEKSLYAGLVPEIMSTYYEETGYNDPENQDHADALWDSIDFDAGIVALSDDYAKEKNLPIAQRFPWDLTKGIYLLNGHHHLHCLKSIHNTILEYRRGVPQSRPVAHVSHCLDALRRQVICDADDTPRASTREFSPNTGVGQSRQCRSWERLESWAADHTACYKYVDPQNTTMSNLERFKFCPEGSPYWDVIREVYPHAGE